MKSSRLWLVRTWCMLAFVFGLAIYRANSQTIAHDEALEYEWFLDGGVGHVLVYNPAQHILFTLLAKPIVWSLGVTEFHLRMPSLLGTAIYLLAGLMVALNLAAKVHYPNSRYGLFLIPLFTLGSLLAGREIYFRFPRWPLKAAGYLLAAAVVLNYSSCVQTASFRYNAYDVISRGVCQAISSDAQERSLNDVRVGRTWWYEPEINFYRRRYKANWMMEYDIKDRSFWWQTPNSLATADYDYFVFTSAGDPGLAGPRVRTIFRYDPRGITVVGISH
jgi:hypothetical protein